MNKNYILMALAVVFLVGALFVQLSPQIEEETSSGSGQQSSVNSVSLTSITYENLATELSQNAMVEDIPSDSSIVLKFYNFNSGEREFERAYRFEQGEISETDTDAQGEIVLTLHSKYLNGLTNQNLCSVIQQADKAGDLGFETSLSKAALAWKFKGMLEHRSCLGM